MAGPPPPPPPPPPPAMGGGPPPPPPPPMAFGSLASKSNDDLPSRPPTGALPDTNALLGDIRKGAKLRKAVTNDRSAPQTGGRVVDGSGGGSAPGRASAPRPPTQAPQAAPAAPEPPSGPPQLAGLFAGGMPKLRHRGGIDTGGECIAPSVQIVDIETNSSTEVRFERARALWRARRVGATSSRRQTCSVSSCTGSALCAKGATKARLERRTAVFG